MGDYINVKEIFGCDVFNDSVMQQRLPKKVYNFVLFMSTRIFFRLTI